MLLVGRIFCCAIAPVLIGAAGCSLIDMSTAFDDKGPGSIPHSTHRVIDYTPGAPSAIRLEITLIDRDSKDPVLGKPLWSELDQLGAIPVDKRLLLQKNGFRVGVAGSTPPPMLSRLISSGDESLLDGIDNRVSTRDLAIFPGTETDVITSELNDEFSVSIFGQESNHTETYRQARGALEVRAARVQSGWVELELVPEIHHGEDRVRRVPTNVGMTFKSGQRQDSQFDLRFRVTLSVGEMVVISCDEISRELLGDYFFRAVNEDGELRRRAVVIRVVDSSEPARVERNQAR